MISIIKIYNKTYKKAIHIIEKFRRIDTFFYIREGNG